jgi:DHA1 family bicyclomycin/chloramphenicol resistance-like MFS transporter
MGVAPVLAPLVGGVIADYLGWRGIFWIHAGVSLLLVVVLFTQLKETRPADTESMTFSDLLRGGRFLVTQPGFMGPSLTYSFFSASGFIFITVGAALYETMFGMSGAEFGLLWSGLAFSFIAGATSAGHLARRFGSARSQRIGMGCNGVATLVFFIAAFLAAAPMWLFSLSLALLMFANGVVQPLALTAAVDDHPQLAGVAAGLSSSIAMLISMVSAIMTGAIYDGSARGCAILMSVTCILAVLALRLGEKAHPVKN